MERVKKLASEKSSVVIAISEGIQLADGRFVCELGNILSSKHPREKQPL